MAESLDEYIGKMREKKVSDMITRENLVEAGWSKKVVNLALAGNEKPPVPSSNQKGNYGLWDAFQHVILFISMYVLVITLILAINLIIDKLFPNLEIDYYYRDENFFVNEMKGYLSSIIVTFPIFMTLLLNIRKRTQKLPEIRNLLIRKVLVYLTMVVNFITFIVAVIALIYGLLDGNLTINSSLQMLNVISFNAVVFFYLMQQVKDDQQITKN